MRQINRVLWMMVDQAVFATSNFIMNVLFARWLTPDEYGMFAVSFSAYLFLTVVHWGAFLEPLLVLSAQIDADTRRSYILTLGVAHVLMVVGATALSAAGFCVALAFGAPDVGWAIVGAGVGGSLMLTLITARRLCLVFLSPRVSAIVGSTYFVGVLASGNFLSTRSLSWFSLWEIMGFWSLICSLAIFGLLAARTTGSSPFPMRKLVKFQSRYAPGAITAALFQWASNDGIYVMLSAMMGLAAVAESRAVFTIANPLVHINLAMHASWLVLFSEQRGKKSNVDTIALLYVVAIVACVTILFFASTPLVQWLYAGRYLDAAWQLPIFVANIGLTGLAAMITSLFKARGGLWQGFAPNICGAVVAVTVGFLAIRHVGQPGAVYAMCAGGAASLAITSLIFRYAYPKERAEVRHPSRLPTA
jgi:O-antigen/teichoic acid export membrane protein